jgi:hypothetical protein
MATELFNVQYRPGLHQPPVMLLCQAVDLDGEKFLWVDGINFDDPVMVPIASVRHAEWMGSFAEFMKANIDSAGKVIEQCQGNYSPTIMARATLYMSKDRRMSAVQAIELADRQAYDLLDEDMLSMRYFSDAASMPLTAQAG